MTVNKNDLIAIRGYLLEDKNFIMSTFLRGIYYGKSAYSDMEKSDFMKYYHNIAESFLNTNVETVKVACLKDDPSVILGYAILTPNKVIHYVFVKKSWRNIGIASSLVSSDFKVSTHLTAVGKSINIAKGIKFNPFAF